MADTTSTGTTPTVDQATPSDTASAQSTGETVQLAAAAAAVEVSAPARGAEASLTVEPGQTVDLKDPVTRFTQDGGDLVIHWENGAHTTVVDALAAGTALILADGTPVSFEQLLAQIPNVDPSAFAPAAVAPAAGPPAGQAAGGAFNAPYEPGTLGAEHGIGGLLGDTTLQFHLLEFSQELAGVFPAVQEIAEFDPCNPDDLRALFLSTWTHGAGQTIVLDGEGSSNATGGSGDDDITGDDRDNELDGGDGNDMLIGGKGNDTLVGDFLVSSSADLTFSDGLHVSNDGGDNQSFDGFRDFLVGGEGNDVVVGEMFLDSEGSGTESDVFITVSNGDGDGNSFQVFNDFLDGGDGNDVVVGDVYWLGGGSEGTREVNLHVINEAGDGSADNNLFDAFNDMLIGGDGRDTLVGDVFLDADPGGLDTDIEFHLDVSNNGGDGNRFFAFNDLMIGGDGDDTMVGDVMIVGTTNTSASMELEISNVNGDGNVFNAFNDHLCGGDGHDLMVGDAFFDGSSGDPYAVSLTVSNYSGDNNTFHAFNDTLLGQEGDDTLVGDVYFRLDDGDEHDARLTVANAGGKGGNGDGNAFFAFNDILDAGDGAMMEMLDGKPQLVYREGGQLLVGDVFYDGSTGNFADIDLRVSNSDGDNNTFVTFNDILISTGDGGDLLVGDVLFDGDEVRGDIDLRVSNTQGDNNTFFAFNDLLTSGNGNDTLVGDVFEKAGSGDINPFLVVSNYNGNDNTFNAFNDTLVGGDAIMDGYFDEGGGQVLVGDVFAGPQNSDGSMDLKVVNQAGGSYGEGDGNVFHAFNDNLTAGNGNDTLVGDVWVDSPKSDASGDIRLVVSNSNGDNNTFDAFNDMLNGGDGDNTLVGDVWYLQGNVEGTEGHALAVSNSGGDFNTFHAFNDTLTSGNGDDLLVGDVSVFGNRAGFSFDSSEPSEIEMSLMVNNVNGHDNTFDAFNDTLIAGDGDNILVGDVLFKFGELGDNNPTAGSTSGQELTLAVSNRSGSDNTFHAFNDTLTAGNGVNINGFVLGSLLVGDVWLNLDGNNTVDEAQTTLLVENRSGFNNEFDVFNDTLTGGNGFDILVGDVYSAASIYDNWAANPDDVTLEVSNFEGDGNTFHAFNDTLTAGGGDDILVGDVAFLDPDASSGALFLEVSNTNDSSSASADNNVFHAFNDLLSGGDGEDLLVGDVAYQGGGFEPILFAVSNTGTSGFAGDNNTFDAFNDTLSGGAGDDLLVGDVGLLNNTSPITVTVTDDGTNNTFTLFSDVIDGDGGDDTLFGDFASGNLGGNTTDNFTPGGLDLSGITDIGSDDTIFSDTIDGGSGDDHIWGQIGDDLLTGGAGADVFHFDGSLLIEPALVVDMDTITDFSGPGGDGDMVDLDVLFDSLGGTFTDGIPASNAADRAADVNIVGNVLTLDSTPDFSITFSGTSDIFADDTDGFTAAQLAALGIDVGG